MTTLGIENGELRIENFLLGREEFLQGSQQGYYAQDPAGIDGDTGHGASHRITVGKTGVPEYACEAAVESLLLRVGEMELYDIDPLTQVVHEHFPLLPPIGEEAIHVLVALLELIRPLVDGWHPVEQLA